MPVHLTPTHHWTCPNCTARSVTHEARPHTRFHACAGLFGITAPFVAAGSRVEVVAVEREDYVGSDTVQTDSRGRPIMAVITRRPDGSNDTAVLAPVATSRAEVP